MIYLKGKEVNPLEKQTSKYLPKQCCHCHMYMNEWQIYGGTIWWCFNVNSIESKSCHFDLNICGACWGWRNESFVSGNDRAPNRHQTIYWNIGDTLHSCIASPHWSMCVYVRTRSKWIDIITFPHQAHKLRYVIWRDMMHLLRSNTKYIWHQQILNQYLDPKLMFSFVGVQ